ncbi:mannosyl-glycoprotein endo-beta-n-acetylglucosaminidase [Lucifera butyrica]|uniref:Mannosyl-glycoprotein endo-beta-n-acetylglucosaminidase n=1 Tax=Lucifera butyrica TaxID=1351585 RepID=A0A498RA25_9FIRM|nr:glucosaminidase domain-containing protein [Lucifera butyrica]VBB07835.1 mannosyl-glycoprotein endo-beta-n-acetylglucosaminidase [Lucifera butyrica]
MKKRCLYLLLLLCAVTSFGGVFMRPASSAALGGQEITQLPVLFDVTIMGPPLATQEQCVSHLLKHNPLPLITVSAAKLVNYYFEEGQREGIRPDFAFAQALHETGYFAYGGDVNPLQNNYCGLGTTGGGVKGAWFPSARIGVRAQIQHLLAYASSRPPVTPLVDPRYELLKRTVRFGKAVTWTDLNGKWAVPGIGYGQRILSIQQRILMGK